MENDADIRRYTAEELRALLAREGSQTDEAKVLAMSEEELERQIAEDPDWRDIPVDWYEHAVAVFPMSRDKRMVELDSEVVNWFEQQGADYHERINAALRALIDESRRSRFSGLRVG